MMIRIGLIGCGGMVIPTAALESMATGRRIDCAARLRQAESIF